MMKRRQLTHCSVCVQRVWPSRRCSVSVMQVKVWLSWVCVRFPPMLLSKESYEGPAPLLMPAISLASSGNWQRRRCCSMFADDVDVFFHNSVKCCWSVGSSGPRFIHITRNLSRFQVWPWLKITLIVCVPPLVRTPLDGRTRNFSGAVVLICNKLCWLTFVPLN